MNTSQHPPISKKAFEALASKRSSHSVSIYVPMYKTGKEQNEHLAQANLRRCINEAHSDLVKYALDEEEINNYLKPITDLISEVDLWRNPADGLAVFLNKDGLNYYLLPIAFESRTYVADHFYLKPLLPMYHNDGVYYLLELSGDYVKLYKCSRYSCKELSIEDIAPDQLEKAVGFDYKSKMLQFRSGQATHRAGSFHGHGEGKDDRYEEMIVFFRAIDKGINQLISDKKAPLVLACSAPLHSIYKEANSYPNLFEKYLGGDPEFRDKKEMHQQSWELMKEHFQEIEKSKLNLFTELYHTSKISYTPSEIIPAALKGKIDTLFVRKGPDLFGLYNKENDTVRFDESKKLTNVSLLNFAAMHTFMQKGKVYELEPNDMPVQEQPLSAIFRY
ncbi:hypothetical protein [Lutimonas vermicola]|uniref:Uncharacterized protein n=1 Tax=Lutimonas vermicola TaxID=414288 RepID=A0ABU9L215_9FLAO